MDVKHEDIIKDGKFTLVGSIALIVFLERAITLFFETLCDMKEKKNNE